MQGFASWGGIYSRLLPMWIPEFSFLSCRLLLCAMRNAEIESYMFAINFPCFPTSGFHCAECEMWKMGNSLSLFLFLFFFHTTGCGNHSFDFFICNFFSAFRSTKWGLWNFDTFLVQINLFLTSSFRCAKCRSRRCQTKM